MNTILSYIQNFFRSSDKWFLIFCFSFVALLTIFNYTFGIETKWLYSIHSHVGKFIGFFALYAVAFIVPYLLLVLFKHNDLIRSKHFWFFLFLAPMIFAIKVSFPGPNNWMAPSFQGIWGKYYGIITNLPFRLLLVVLPLLFFWWRDNPTPSFWGLTTKNFQLQPYLILLLIMVPLIAFASTQPDFLKVYPKVNQVAFLEKSTPYLWFYKCLFEISYGLDFVTIELFFRGFLVFVFVRYVGEDALLPMAVFYCSIHFGKPLFECISSFFGGILLGVIAYRTKSILGGLIAHIGIAWLMELGALVGHEVK